MTRPDLSALFWRTGQKTTGPGAHRVIYAMTGGEPSEHDPMIGSMDSAALSRAAVRDHNAALEAQAGNPAIAGERG